MKKPSQRYAACTAAVAEGLGLSNDFGVRMERDFSM